MTSYEFLTKENDNLASEKIKYCLLTYIYLKNGRYTLQTINDKSNGLIKYIKEIKEEKIKLQHIKDFFNKNG